MTTPIVLPMFVNAATNRMRVALFFEKSPKESSRLSDSKSWTFGGLYFASTAAANQPLASAGCSVVNGAAIKAVRMEKGCARASAAPAAEKIPVIMNQ